MLRTNLAYSDAFSISPQQQYPIFRRSHTAATESRWQAKVLERMTSLIRLPAGWDSYGAPAPRYEAAMFALEVLQRVMRNDTPVPAVVPSSTGGIQLEWHEKSVDLEIHIEAPYKGDVWWRDEATGKEICADLGADLSFLMAPIGNMSPVRST